MDDSKIFVKKYRDYLPQIKSMDVSQKSEILGIRKQDDVCIFDFFNRPIAFDGQFIDIQNAEVTPAVKFVLCKYMLRCPDTVIKASDRLVTFWEFSNAGPLVYRFSDNTGKIMTTTFSGYMDKLKSRCLSLGGTFVDTESYDISVSFHALPRVPIILNFNDQDERMPATAGILFHDDAEVYLDQESLIIICTWLTGFLIQDN